MRIASYFCRNSLHSEFVICLNIFEFHLTFYCRTFLSFSHHKKRLLFMYKILINKAAWTAIDRLSIIWKSNLTNKMKRSFFKAAVVSILQYGCTTWTLTIRLEKKLDGNYTKMLNKSWQQHPTRHQLYGHLPLITKTIQAKRTIHAGHCWRNKGELISDVLRWTPAYGQAKQDDQLEHTYSSYVRIRDIALTTSQRLWIIRRSGERESVISVLAGTTWWWWLLLFYSLEIFSHQR